MRTISGFLVMFSLIFVSCGNRSTKNNQSAGSTEKAPAVNIVTPAVPASDSLTAAQVTEVTGAVPADTAAAKGGTNLLVRADFLKKVWDYEKNPQQWVFLGERPAIIDFYADWCGPCKIAGPILEEVSWQFAGQVDFYKIDTQREQELAAVFGISGIPAFLYIPRTGKPTLTSGIARSKEETRQMFVDNINNLLLKDK